ncbi:MAG: hypothetical protein AAFS10_11485, partial [Myxococcota bacterium]
MRIQSLWYVLVLSLLLVGMTGCGDETDGGGSTAGDGSILGPDGSGGGDGTGDSNSTGGGDSNTTTETRTLAVLGNGAHTMDAVAAMALVGPQEGLFGPRDLEFKPDADMELWVVNRNDNSMTIIQDAGGAAMDIMTVSHFSGGHFMVNPISL